MLIKARQPGIADGGQSAGFAGWIGRRGPSPAEGPKHTETNTETNRETKRAQRVPDGRLSAQPAGPRLSAEAGIARVSGSRVACRGWGRHLVKWEWTDSSAAAHDRQDCLPQVARQMLPGGNDQLQLLVQFDVARGHLETGAVLFILPRYIPQLLLLIQAVGGQLGRKNCRIGSIPAASNCDNR